ncbi:hypothetical protein AB0E04_49220 [Streptomyces sp. NPDC048251]|uniref:hypothetical protein n=1 Tax=Streptomyces sp. NPDC048251 TaxID=3154501 RepID=UPI0034262245
MRRTDADQDDDLLDDDFTDDAFDDITDSAAVLQRVASNNGTVIGVLIKKGIHRLQGIPLPADEVDEYLAPYVRHDADHLAINKILDEHHVVVLAGSEGSGRFTTALDVLHTRAGANIRQVRREPGERFAIEGLREYDTGWILDLRGEQPPPALGRQLAQDTPQLASTGSYLVVLCHPKAGKASGSGAAHLTRHLSEPDPQAVLRRRLDQAVFPIPTARWLGEPVITDGIAHCTSARVVTWAEAIIAAERLRRRRHPASPAQDEAAFRDMVLEVAHAAQNWHDELLAWHTENTNSDYRNYLLAAAVLEGATAETVYTASAELARALEEDPIPRPGQQGLGVIALTRPTQTWDPTASSASATPATRKRSSTTSSPTGPISWAPSPGGPPHRPAASTATWPPRSRNASANGHSTTQHASARLACCALSPNSGPKRCPGPPATFSLPPPWTRPSASVPATPTAGGPPTTPTNSPPV